MRLVRTVSIRQVYPNNHRLGFRIPGGTVQQFVTVYFFPTEAAKRSHDLPCSAGIPGHLSMLQLHSALL